MLLLLYTPVRAIRNSAEEEWLLEEAPMSHPSLAEEYDEPYHVERRGFLHSMRLGRRGYAPSKKGFLTASRLG